MVDTVHAGGLFAEGSFDPHDKLIAGEGDFQRAKKVLISGQNLVRGALLGQITASGKLTLWTTGASDGSQAMHSVLLQDCDASGGDAACLIHETGVFAQQGIIGRTGGLSEFT